MKFLTSRLQLVQLRLALTFLSLAALLLCLQGYQVRVSVWRARSPLGVVTARLAVLGFFDQAGHDPACKRIRLRHLPN